MVAALLNGETRQIPHLPTMAHPWACSALVSGHSGRQQRDPEPERPQQRCERAVQFVAESSTPLLDDLVDEGALVDDNFACEGDIEILKGNSGQVSVMDGAKCVSSGRSGIE